MTPKDAFALYEEGKHRRYGLLFSVNGGAFAVAKLLTGVTGETGKTAPAAPAVLGDLSLSQLAPGMILFTVVMTGDIYAFGDKMRKKDNFGEGMFGVPGKIVLISLGALLCAGWFLAGLCRGCF